MKGISEFIANDSNDFEKGQVLEKLHKKQPMHTKQIDVTCIGVYTTTVLSSSSRFLQSIETIAWIILELSYCANESKIKANYKFTTNSVIIAIAMIYISTNNIIAWEMLVEHSSQKHLPLQFTGMTWTLVWNTWKNGLYSIYNTMLVALTTSTVKARQRHQA